MGTQHADERVLQQDYSDAITGDTWYWIGTQYANGDWLRPQEGHLKAYSLLAAGPSEVELTTNCTRGQGSYELSQEDLSASFDARVEDSCETAKIDSRFINDLNDAIGVDIDGDRMTLRLDSDVGVMHFRSQ